jgi:hypothetical protein
MLRLRGMANVGRHKTKAGQVLVVQRMVITDQKPWVFGFNLSTKVW